MLASPKFKSQHDAAAPRKFLLTETQHLMSHKVVRASITLLCWFLSHLGCLVLGIVHLEGDGYTRGVFKEE